MRIVVLQDYLRVGGTERQSLYLAGRFAAEGHQVVLLLLRPGGPLWTGFEDASFEVRVLQKRSFGSNIYAPSLFQELKSMSPDCVLCMGRTANCYSGLIQKRLPACAVISTIRTGKPLFPLHSWSLRKVRAVLVNSNWWKRRMLERGFTPEHVHVVHNSNLLEHSIEERREVRKTWRKRMEISEDTCIFLCVATFRSGKRHLDLIRIFEQFRSRYPEWDSRLWLVGDGKERRKCERWVAENGLGTRVQFWGAKSDPFPYYCAADVAVSASREDSLPNFLIESQAAGLPIVAYDFRGVIECCEPDKSGVVVPMGDADRFCEAMTSLADKGKSWKSMSARAEIVAREKFSAEPRAHQILAFLQSCVDEERKA